MPYKVEFLKTRGYGRLGTPLAAKGLWDSAHLLGRVGVVQLPAFAPPCSLQWEGGSLQQRMSLRDDFAFELGVNSLFRKSYIDKYSWWC